jgi:hypothetical protein
MFILRYEIPIEGAGIMSGRLFLLRPDRSRAWLLPINTNPPAVVVTILSASALGWNLGEKICFKSDI